LGFLVATVGPQDAEDCFQETFLAALRAYPRLKHGDNLRAWLLTIAHRKAIDHHRARARRPGPVAEVPEKAAAAHISLNGVEPGLWRVVAELPPKQRSALALRFAADMPYRDIGAAIDCSEEAARRNVHEGLEKLRKELT